MEKLKPREVIELKKKNSVGSKFKSGFVQVPRCLPVISATWEVRQEVRLVGDQPGQNTETGSQKNPKQKSKETPFKKSKFALHMVQLLQRLRQEDHMVEASLGNLVYLKIKSFEKA